MDSCDTWTEALGKAISLQVALKSAGQKLADVAGVDRVKKAILTAIASDRVRPPFPPLC